MKLLDHFQHFLAETLETREQVFQIIKAIYELNLNWTQNEVLGAWEKPRKNKQDQLSVKARELGNAAMKNGQWTRALMLYNEAVILAETNGLNLALALANRAFVWMKLEEFDFAQVDLLWIIEMGKYPKGLHYIT